MDSQTYITLRDIAILFANLMLFKYFVFLVLAPFYPAMETRRKIRILRNKLKNSNKEYKPKISVIVPAWNEEVGVIKTIKSVIKNDYENIEIVVINDGSTDKTAEKIYEFIQQNCTNSGLVVSNNTSDGKYINFIDNKQNGGKGVALNTGIMAASGEIILTVDADSALDRYAIKNLAKYYEDPEIAGVVGNVKVANAGSIIGIAQKLEYTFGFYFKRAHALMNAEYIFGGACASFRKEVFDNIGYYDIHNKTEDIEMTMRFRHAGYKCTYGEDVICYTEGASTITGLINQRLRWKKGRMDTFFRYRNLFFSVNKEHSKPLTLFILPYAVISEFQLFFEPIFIALLVGYSFISLDFISLSFGILFLFVVYLVNALFNGKNINLKLLLAFPATWVLFYFLMWVEFLSLIRGTFLLLKGQNIEWQKWNRQGI